MGARVGIGPELAAPDAVFGAVNAQPGSGGAALFDLRSVTDFTVRDARRVQDQHVPDTVQRKRI